MSLDMALFLLGLDTDTVILSPSHLASLLLEAAGILLLETGSRLLLE